MFDKAIRFAIAGTVCLFTSLATAETLPPIRLVSAPTPNVFPLLLAMARHPDLPVQLLPVGNSGIVMDDEFTMDDADGMLGMTYGIAQTAVRLQQLDLRLRGVFFWRGFFAMLPKSSTATSLAELTGKGLLVSGPLTGGRGGAPDLLFKAALKRAGHTEADYAVCYLPAKEGIELMASQAPMNSNPGCDKSQSSPVTAFFLVEPAATGLVMKSNMFFNQDVPVRKGINIENLFTGYTDWPQGQLPQGGWALRASVVNNPARQAQVAAVEQALQEAAQELAEASKKGLISRLRLAYTISSGIHKAYGAMGIDLPTLVLAKALGDGDLIYRSDMPLAKIRPDLQKFLAEVMNVPVAPQLLQ